MLVHSDDAHHHRLCMLEIEIEQAEVLRRTEKERCIKCKTFRLACRLPRLLLQKIGLRFGMLRLYAARDWLSGCIRAR